MKGLSSPNASKPTSRSSSCANSLDCTAPCNDAHPLTYLASLLAQGLNRQPSLNPSYYPISDIRNTCEALGKVEPSSVKIVKEWVDRMERSIQQKEAPQFLFDICTCCNLSCHYYYLVACSACTKPLCLNCICARSFHHCPNCQVAYTAEESASLDQRYAYWTANFPTQKASN